MYTVPFGKRIDIRFAPDIRRYTDDLSCMLRCRTISAKPHFDRAEFEKFDRLMRNRFPQTFARAESIDIGMGTFLKIPGSTHGAPLLLMSHTDVVASDGQRWKHPAFASDHVKGRIWGRGAVDTKGSLCTIFEAVESLLEEGCEFVTDVYILSSSNEETAGADTANAVAYLKKAGITPRLVVDEGGAVLRNPILFSKVKRFAMIGMTERSSARLLIEAKNEKEAKKIKADMKRLNLGHAELIPETKELLKGLSQVLPFPLSCAVKALVSHENAAVKLLMHAGKDAQGFCGAVCGTPKISEKEMKDISTAEHPVVINISGNYYNKIDKLIEEFEAIAKKKGLKTALLRSREAPPPVSTKTDGYRFVGDTAKVCFENIAVLPYPVLGATDARHFVGFADNVIRFIPVEINLQQLMSFHNANENIFDSSLAPAVGYYRELILRYFCLD